ncbi:hypothetical protein [Nitrobacter hamburgensis]|uniref:hypothetical protein n=1 Tax=Nitrobacter hamburgensis TaxID=912 RepID=UPI00059CA29D|nr:hypothetical protein [Nitrobacter hamburgensis]
MILQAGFGRGGDRLELHGEAGGRRRGSVRVRISVMMGSDDYGAPLLEVFLLVPVEVVDQRVALGRMPRLTGDLAGQRAVGLGDRRVNGGEDIGQSVVGRASRPSPSAI